MQVKRPAASVHADGDALALQYAAEALAGELRALVAVKHFGLAVHAQSVFQAVNTERRFHTVADAPAEHPPRVPVDDGHQVDKTARQPDVDTVLKVKW